MKLQIRIDPGGAGPELIAELLLAISAAYRAAGGGDLSFEVAHSMFVVSPLNGTAPKGK